MASPEDPQGGQWSAPKADPADFALRARPRAVTRLSRRALIVSAGSIAVCVVGAVWWAFALHSFRITTGKELYNTDVRPSADAIGGLPNGYASLTKPKPPPAPPRAVPRLGPPLPGDLGRPMLGQGAPTAFAPPTNGADQAAARLRAQAADAGVFFTVAANTGGTNGAAGPAPGVAPVGQPAPGTAGGDGALAAPHGDQNQQDAKQAFLKSPVDRAIYSPDRLQTPLSPYELMAGDGPEQHQCVVLGR